MFMLNIMITILGTAFFAFGFLVCFEKKYSLVSPFITDKSRDNDRYREQLGLIGNIQNFARIYIVEFYVLFSNHQTQKLENFVATKSSETYDHLT